MLAFDTFCIYLTFYVFLTCKREWQYKNKSSILDILLILVLKTTWRQQHIPPTMPRIRRPPEKIHNPILAIWSLVPIASFSLKWSYYNLNFIWHLISKTQDMEGIRDRKNIATLPGSLKLSWWETSDCFSAKYQDIIERNIPRWKMLALVYNRHSLV